MASYGPALPPGLKTNATDSAEEEDDGYKGAGPSLPPNFKRRHSDSEDTDSDSESDSSDSDSYERKKQKTEQGSSIGPILPHGFKKASSDSEEEDEECIGPMPLAGLQDENTAAMEFEMRAQKMKNKLLNKDVPAPKERESWMMELPKVGMKNFPLENRSFSRSTVKSEQDSSWTETPADKEKREQALLEGRPVESKSKKAPRLAVVSSRDKNLAKQVDEYNKTKRAESLLDLHQKKIHKKKDKKKKDKKSKKEKKKEKKKKEKEKEKKKAEKKERRPFDRDEDLKANHFDDAQRKLMIKKSAQLNSRFGHGDKQFI